MTGSGSICVALRGALSTLCGLAVLAGAAAGAEIRDRPRAVLELFTSQGCASCPPADALLKRLGARDDVIALAYHVDYWDYVGWADTFGSQANSDRQRGYLSALGLPRLYTPQMLVNGQADAVGSNDREVAALMQAARLDVPVDLRERDGTLEVSIGARPGGGEAVVWLVQFAGEAEVEIERGENGGQRNAYSHVVLGRQALGVWQGATGAAVSLPIDQMLAEEADGVAILVQEDDEGRPGPIVGAASYRP